MAVKSDCPLRELDIRSLQRHLVGKGNLPEEVLQHQDSFPVSDSELSVAVETIRGESEELALVLAHADRALPLLKEAYHGAIGRDKLAYAKILGMLGDATGLDSLVNAVQTTDAWDEPPSYQIGSNYPDYREVGWSLSKLDNTIIALGRTGRNEALPVILEKLKLLGPKSSFSHYRSVALALEHLGQPQAARPLAEALQQPGMMGHVHLALDEADDADAPQGGTLERVSSAWDVSGRSRSVRELALARALYHCGDYDDLAKNILTQYTRDLRGHFARHAKAVLKSRKK